MRFLIPVRRRFDGKRTRAQIRVYTIQVSSDSEILLKFRAEAFEETNFAVGEASDNKDKQTRWDLPKGGFATIDEIEFGLFEIIRSRQENIPRFSTSWVARDCKKCKKIHRLFFGQTMHAISTSQPRKAVCIEISDHDHRRVWFRTENAFGHKDWSVCTWAWRAISRGKLKLEMNLSEWRVLTKFMQWVAWIKTWNTDTQKHLTTYITSV